MTSLTKYVTFFRALAMASIAMAALPLSIDIARPVTCFQCWAQEDNDTTYYPPSTTSNPPRARWWRADTALVNHLSAPSADSQQSATAESSTTAAAQPVSADSVSPEAAAIDSQPPAPLWMGCYGEGVRRFNEDNTLQGFVDVKVGRRVFGRIPADVYAQIQGSRDVAGLPWNNRADAGLGLSVEPWRLVPVTLFAEGIIGNYVPSIGPSVQNVYPYNALENGPGNTSPFLDSIQRVQDSLQTLNNAALFGPTGQVREIKIGALYSKGWGDDAGNRYLKSVCWAFRPWAYVYSELVYSHLEHTYTVARERGLLVRYEDSLAVLDNAVLYANPKAGIMLVDGAYGTFSVCATLYAWIDTHQDWWNNKMWGGPLLRYRPLPALDFVIETGYMLGGYTGISNPSDWPNPYPKAVSTWQFGVFFDYSLGTRE